MEYLDNAAGTKPDKAVINSIVDTLQNNWGNYSAENTLSVNVRKSVGEATDYVAQYVNCYHNEIIWTSGACESNSLAIMGTIRHAQKMHKKIYIITSELEHASIYEAINHNLDLIEKCFFVKNNIFGAIDETDLNDILLSIPKNDSLILVSISSANSEIGTVQNIKKISQISHKYNAIFHTDATQLFSLGVIDVEKMGIDIMSASGQKFGCTKGVGILYKKNEIKLEPIIYGTQQYGLRGGTIATHLICAFEAALKEHREFMKKHEETLYKNLFTFYSLLFKKLEKNNIVFYINGELKKYNITKDEKTFYYKPLILSITLKDVDSEQLISICNMNGVILARGSACKSHNNTPSRALKAICLSDEETFNTIRISCNKEFLIKDIEHMENIVDKIIDSIIVIKKHNGIDI